MAYGYWSPSHLRIAALIALRPCLLMIHRRARPSVVKEDLMIRKPNLCALIVFAAIFVFGAGQPARGQDEISVQQTIETAQAALRHRHYLQAIRTLEDSLQRYPGNVT